MHEQDGSDRLAPRAQHYGGEKPAVRVLVQSVRPAAAADIQPPRPDPYAHGVCSWWRTVVVHLREGVKIRLFKKFNR